LIQGATLTYQNFDGFITNLDSLLRPICEKLQLSQPHHEETDARYQSISQWLDCSGSPLSEFQPKIYPQGSLPISTTTKPLSQQEFDLDFVLELNMAWEKCAPLTILDLLEDRLKEHGTYRPMLRRKNRCIRLIYANRFHIDILPAVPAGFGPEGCLKVPDRKAKGWKDSNPKGFIKWFNNRGSLYKIDSRFHEPLPAHETLDEKTTLQCAVQLLKRWRDIYFFESQDLAPVSIVLTTLAGKHYSGEDSVEEAVTAILSGIVETVANCQLGRRLVVLNPSNPQEDLSERWNDPHAYHAFVKSIQQFHQVWQKLLSTKGLDAICGVLKQLFGEQLTNEVCDELAQRIAKEGQAGITTGRSNQPGRIVTGAGVGTIEIPRHTFYGSTNSKRMGATTH